MSDMQPTRRGLLGALIGGLFLVTRAKRADAVASEAAAPPPPPAPPAAPVPLADTAARVYTYAYDVAGAGAESLGRVTTYTYSSGGRLVKIEDPLPDHDHDAGKLIRDLLDEEERMKDEG